MKALRRHAPRALLGLAVSGTLLYFAFRHADLGDVAGVIRRVSPQALALAVVANMGLHLVTALKWRWIARGAFEGKVRHFFGAVAIGEMSSNVLPVRLDEPLRAWWLHRKAGAPAARIFGTIVLD
ncbi:MAG: flippase-like domain-containing protein, partial [Candidatus Methylomirabilis sp.]|nr:flippase-like domain-containing protein [Deltaproteobacteria bacterium]